MTLFYIFICLGKRLSEADSFPFVSKKKKKKEEEKVFKRMVYVVVQVPVPADARTSLGALPLLPDPDSSGNHHCPPYPVWEGEVGRERARTSTA